MAPIPNAEDRCFQRSRPAGTPGTAQDLLAMRVGIHRDQKGGQVSLLSPASLLARPAGVREAGIGAFQVILHESVVGV